MHKSSIFVVIAFVLILVLRHIRFTKLMYGFLFVLLLVFSVIPIDQIMAILIPYLPINQTMGNSIIHHLSVAIQFQSVFLIYVTLFLCLAFQKLPAFDRSWKTILLIALIGLALIAFFYRNWFLLNRLRSYFLPFILLYCIHVFEIQKENNRLLQQVLACVMCAYCLLLTYSYYDGLKKPENKINETSTIFALRHKSEQQIKTENLRKAEIFWQNYRKYRADDKQ